MKKTVLTKIIPCKWETPDHQFRVEKAAGRYIIYVASPDGGWEWAAEAETLQEARRLVKKK